MKAPVPVGNWCVAVESVPARPSKTAIWEIRPAHQPHSLGEVRWRSAWRRYAFWPAAGCVFEADCLRSIAQFCEDETALRRRAARLEREAMAGGAR